MISIVLPAAYLPCARCHAMPGSSSCFCAEGRNPAGASSAQVKARHREPVKRARRSGWADHAGTLARRPRYEPLPVMTLDERRSAYARLNEQSGAA